MAGFDNNVMYADNVDFTGSISPTAQITSDGELLIGSTASPNIRVGSLASAGGTITITVGSGTINLETSASGASSFPVDNGVVGIPSAGAMSFLGSTSTDFPNSSGLETHVGATTNEIYLENRRYFSSLVVDPSSTVGLRGEFTTITAALAAAVAGDTIYVRPGTYTENITLVAGVNLIGLTTSGVSNSVILAGSITANYTGKVDMENFDIVTPAGDALISTAGTPEFTAIRCRFAPTAGTVCSSGNSGLEAIFTLSNLDSPAGTNLFSPTAGMYILFSSFTNNGGSDLIIANGTSTINIINSNIFHGVETTGTAEILLSNCICITGAVEAINVNSAGSLINCFHNSIISIAFSTNFAIGTGTFIYGDVVNVGSATGVAGTLTQTIPDWKPYGLADDSTVGVNAFNSSDFTVDSTTGVVSSIVSPSFLWREETGSSATFSTNEGIITNDISGGGGFVTLTLPAVCALGDVLRIAGKGAGGWRLAQLAGQVIHFDGQDTTTGVGGSLSSTVRYDCIELLCTVANTDYTVLSSVGNITIV